MFGWSLEIVWMTSMTPADCRPVFRPSQFLGPFVVPGLFLFLPSDVTNDIVETSIISRAQKGRGPCFQMIHQELAGPPVVELGESTATRTAAVRRNPHQAEEPSHPRSRHGTFLYHPTVRTPNRLGTGRFRAGTL